MARLTLVALVAAAGLLALAGAAGAQQSDPNPGVDRWFDADQTVRFDHVPGGASDEDGGPPQVTVDSKLDIHEFKYQGRTYTADGFRDAYQRGFVDDADVARFEAGIRAQFNRSLDRTLPLKGEPQTTPARMSQNSLEADTGGSPYHPPLLVNVSGGGPIDLSALADDGATPPSEEDVEVALELGATLDVPLTLEARPGANVSAVILSPAGLVYQPNPALEVASDGSEASVEITNWKSSDRASYSAPLDVTDPDERAFETERVDLQATVDLQGIDVQPTQFPSGSAGTATGKLTVDGDFRVLALPPGQAPQLREAGVTHVSSDDIRLLLERGYVSRETLEQQVDNVTDRFEGKTPDGVDAIFRGGLQDPSLEGVGQDENETARPVDLLVEADFIVDLSPATARSASGGQAVTLHTLERSFDFPALGGYETAYEVILPKGMAIQEVSSPEVDVETSTTPDGRDVFSLVVPAGEEDAQVTATITTAVTASFLWHQAWELLAILAVLLLVPLVILLAILRRRRGEGEPERVEGPPQEHPPDGGSGD